MPNKQNNNSPKQNSGNRNQNKKKNPMPKSQKAKSFQLPYKSKANNMMVQAPGVSNNKISRKQPYKMLQNARPRVSAAGMAFLKCAFAPPDFSGSDVKGVPDSFEGKSLVKKHRFISDFTFAAGRDTYFLLLPVPGYAYFTTSVAAGSAILPTTAFVGVPYSDFNNLFNSAGVPSESCANIVDKFRFVSNHFEMVPTTNAMSWTGNVQTFRFPLSMFIRQSTATTTGDLWSVAGLQSINATNADQYTGPFNLGCYTAAYNTGNGFAFNSILERVVSVPTTVGLGDFGQLSGLIGFTGLDANFDAVCIKVSGVGSNSLDTCILKTWACVEYQSLVGSSVYEYQTFSPCDPVALDMYRAIIKELPIGVSFMDNEGFWMRVLNIVRRISGVGAAVPGPYGAIASGVNIASNALYELTL